MMMMMNSLCKKNCSVFVVNNLNATSLSEYTLGSFFP